MRKSPRPAGFQSPRRKLSDIGEAFKSGGLLGIGRWSLQVFHSSYWRPEIESYPCGSTRAKIAMRRAWKGWAMERKSVAKPVKEVLDEKTIARNNQLNNLTWRVNDRIRLDFMLSWLLYIRNLRLDLRAAVRIVHKRMMSLQRTTFQEWRNLRLKQAILAQEEDEVIASQWGVKDSPTAGLSPEPTREKFPEMSSAKEQVSVSNVKRSPSPRLEIVSDSARPVSQRRPSFEKFTKDENQPASPQRRP
eukprot:2578503-Rhodomonas_salina.1